MRAQNLFQRSANPLRCRLRRGRLHLQRRRSSVDKNEKSQWKNGTSRFRDIFGFTRATTCARQHIRLAYSARALRRPATHHSRSNHPASPHVTAPLRRPRTAPFRTERKSTKGRRNCGETYSRGFNRGDL